MISGYWAIGNILRVTKPATTMIRASTVANIGLLIKNFTIACLFYRFDSHAISYLKQGGGDIGVFGADTGGHLAKRIVYQLAHLDRTVSYDIGVVHDIKVLP